MTKQDKVRELSEDERRCYGHADDWMNGRLRELTTGDVATLLNMIDRLSATPPAEPSALSDDERFYVADAIALGAAFRRQGGSGNDAVADKIAGLNCIIQRLATHPIAPVNRGVCPICEATPTQACLTHLVAACWREQPLAPVSESNGTTTAASGVERATGDRRLVPVEPTDKQINSAYAAMRLNSEQHGYDRTDEQGIERTREVYRAMLAAAPAVEQVGESEVKDIIRSGMKLGARDMALAQTTAGVAEIVERKVSETAGAILASFGSRLVREE